MKNLIKIIKLRGYQVKDFARVNLGMKYNTFKTQVDKGTMRYKDLVIALQALSINFEDLKGKEFETAAKRLKIKNTSSRALKEIKSEQEWAKSYAYLLSKANSHKLLCSILQEERRLSLRAFCIKYQITELK